MTIDHQALACEVEAADSDDVLYGVVATLYPPTTHLGLWSVLSRLLDVGGALSVAERMVPAGHRYLLDKRPCADSRTDGYRAQVYRDVHPYKSDGSDTPGSWAGSSARALTAAALRAMAADHSVDANKMVR